MGIMKKIVSGLMVCLAILITVVLVHAADDAEKVEKPKIAVIPKGTTHSFWKSIHAGARKAAEEFGADINWQGPQKEDDRQLQIQVVQTFISRKVDAIVLAPLDNRALVPSVEAAVKRGIKVIIIDSDLNSEKHSSFVATDNTAGGKLCAKRLSEIMGGKGKALMLRYAEGSASTANREQGFLDGMKEFGPDIELVSTTQYAGATMEKAFQAARIFSTVLVKLKACSVQMRVPRRECSGRFRLPAKPAKSNSSDLIPMKHW